MAGVNTGADFRSTRGYLRCSLLASGPFTRSSWGSGRETRRRRQPSSCNIRPCLFSGQTRSVRKKAFLVTFVCGQAGFGWLPSKRNAHRSLQRLLWQDLPLRPCPLLPQWRPMITSKEGLVPLEAAHAAFARTASLPCAEPQRGGVPPRGSPAPVSSIAPSLLRFAHRLASFAQIFSKFPLVPIVSFLSRTVNNKWSFSPRR